MRPALGFPEFTADWVPKHGLDAFRSRRERAWAGLPLYSVTMDQGMVRRDSLDRQFSSNSPDEANLRAAEGDQVYNMMRMWQGAVGQAPEECMVSPAYVVLQPKSEAATSFFDYWFKRQRSIYLLWAYSYGLTNDRLRLYARDFYKVPMHLPSREEQQKIADFLKTIDLRISKLETRRRLLENFKRGAMQQVFSRTLRFAREDGTAYPDWHVGSLADAFRERTVRGNGDGELLSVTLRRGVRKASEVSRVNEASEDRSNYKKVRVGDIAYNSMRMWQGASGVSKFEGIVSPAYTVIYARDGHDPAFWAHYFKLPTMIHKFKRYSQGLTSDTWSLKFPNLAQIKAEYPTVEEQRQIAKFLSVLDEKVDAATQQIDQMLLFKKALLQQMFV